jgi:hypothetical protein
MKKIILPVMIVAIIVGLYEQTKPSDAQAIQLIHFNALILKPKPAENLNSVRLFCTSYL